MKIFVFDLDFTLWNAGGTWCDATNPPYKWNNNKLLDRSGKWIRLYPDVVKILNELKQKNKFVVLASRTFEPKWAQELIEHFNIDYFFDLKEIYPASKIQHFKKIKNHFKIPYKEMVFFDDEYRNIEEVRSLGVKSVLLQNGITFDVVRGYL